jgi:hypothetical protein
MSSGRERGLRERCPICSKEEDWRHIETKRNKDVGGPDYGQMVEDILMKKYILGQEDGRMKCNGRK